MLYRCLNFHSRFFLNLQLSDIYTFINHLAMNTDMLILHSSDNEYRWKLSKLAQIVVSGWAQKLGKSEFEFTNIITGKIKKSGT